jgi:hypothetical protein
MNQNIILYNKKYLKYKLKYLELKKQIGGIVHQNIYISDSKKNDLNCVISDEIYDQTRIPSFCDRIIYKGNLKIINYGTILASKLCGSDHLVVFGEFEYNNELRLVITFNIDKLDKDSINNELIKNSLENIILKISNRSNLDYYDQIILCFQESASTSNLKMIINSIVDKINLSNLTNLQYTMVYSKSKSLTHQNTKIFIIYKNNIKSIEKIYPIYFGNTLQYLAKSKSAIGIVIDNLCYICCHLPINTNEKNYNSDYLGNKLRIKALKKIIENISKYQNVIICGDFNFRIYNTQNDKLEQFNDLLLNKPKFLIEYHEFGKLKVKSCKINSNTSCHISL